MVETEANIDNASVDFLVRTEEVEVDLFFKRSAWNENETYLIGLNNETA